jgi:hypothetical protein
MQPGAFEVQIRQLLAKKVVRQFSSSKPAARLVSGAYPMPLERCGMNDLDCVSGSYEPYFARDNSSHSTSLSTHSRKVISVTSILRRSTLRRRSFHPDGGMPSLVRRSDRARRSSGGAMSSSADVLVVKRVLEGNLSGISYDESEICHAGCNKLTAGPQHGF